MNSEQLVQLARQIGAHRGHAPTFLLVRELELFEVEFAALEFAEEQVLPLIDWGVLAITRTLQVASPRDVDALLGLGELVSEAVVRRLVDERMLEIVSDEESGSDISARRRANNRGIVEFLRRLIRRKHGESSNVAEIQPLSEVIDASRHRLRHSTAAQIPRVALTSSGEFALDEGEIVYRRRRPLRAVFSAKPLFYFTTVDEKRQRFSQYQRPKPIAAADMPLEFLFLDEVLSLAPEQRLIQCGIEHGIPNMRGELIGVVPGQVWEVRRIPTRREPPMIAIAVFPNISGDGEARHVYTRIGAELVERTMLAPTKLVHEYDATELRNLSGVGIDASALRDDGAFQYACTANEMLRLMTTADRPSDSYALSELEGWTLATRLHLVPADEEAQQEVFFEYLRRHDVELNSDFDGTCRRVAALLSEYWEASDKLPGPDEVAAALWARTGLRAALCRRRLNADLIAPYAGTHGGR